MVIIVQLMCSSNTTTKSSEKKKLITKEYLKYLDLSNLETIFKSRIERSYTSVH